MSRNTSKTGSKASSQPSIRSGIEAQSGTRRPSPDGNGWITPIYPEYVTSPAKALGLVNGWKRTIERGDMLSKRDVATVDRMLDLLPKVIADDAFPPANRLGLNVALGGLAELRRDIERAIDAELLARSIERVKAASSSASLPGELPTLGASQWRIVNALQKFVLSSLNRTQISREASPPLSRNTVDEHIPKLIELRIIESADNGRTYQLSAIGRRLAKDAMRENSALIEP